VILQLTIDSYPSHSAILILQPRNLTFVVRLKSYQYLILEFFELSPDINLFEETLSKFRLILMVLKRMN
jgi:hypothetical protein